MREGPRLSGGDFHSDRTFVISAPDSALLGEGWMPVLDMAMDSTVLSQATLGIEACPDPSDGAELRS
jgi:hypothetical protein